MQLKDKIALVSGATTGIGRASAERFLGEGVKTLIITGQDEERLEAARAALFLASDESSYMRGAEIAVDGGWTSL